MRLILCAGLLAALLSPALAQQAPRIDGFEFKNGATVRNGEAAADGNVAVIGSNVGAQADLKAFIGDERCMVLNVMDVGNGKFRVIVTLPSDLDKGNYEFKLENSVGESNTLRLKIVDEEDLGEQVGEGQGLPAETKQYMTLNAAYVEDRGGRLTIVCPGTSRFPASTSVTGELMFFDDVIRRSSFLVQGDQSFAIEFAMEPGVKLRPGIYQIAAHFNLRTQRRRQKSAITRMLGDDTSEYEVVSTSTLVTHDEDGMAVANQLDKEHYTAMCDMLERAANQLYDAYAAAAKIHGQTDEGYVADEWWTYVRRSTDCVPRGLSAEERDALREKWAADERFTKGRSDVRFDDRAWRSWLDEEYRGEQIPGLSALADKHADHLGQYSFPANPESAAMVHDALAILLDRSAKFSINLYRRAGEEIDPNDQRGRLFSNFEGQSSDSSREAFDQLLRRIRRKMRISEE